MEIPDKGILFSRVKKVLKNQRSIQSKTVFTYQHTSCTRGVFTMVMQLTLTIGGKSIGDSVCKLLKKELLSPG
jgi:hypothetical protein